MQEAFVQISRSLDLMAWGLMFIVFLTFLALVWSGYIAYLIRREGIAGRHATARAGRSEVDSVRFRGGSERSVDRA